MSLTCLRINDVIQYSVRVHDEFLIFSFFNTKVHYADDTFVFVSVYLQSRTSINSVILLLLLKGETTVI